MFGGYVTLETILLSEFDATIRARERLFTRVCCRIALEKAKKFVKNWKRLIHQRRSKSTYVVACETPTICSVWMPFHTLCTETDVHPCEWTEIEMKSSLCNNQQQIYDQNLHFILKVRSKAFIYHVWLEWSVLRECIATNGANVGFSTFVCDFVTC